MRTHLIITLTLLSFALAGATAHAQMTGLGYCEGCAGGGSPATFDAMTDTPASKTGAGSQCVKVNVGETALEYGACPAADTNASTICTGTTTYLDGEGNCDALTSSPWTDNGTTLTPANNEGIDLNGFGTTDTAIKINTPASYTGSILDIQEDGNPVLKLDSDGKLILRDDTGVTGTSMEISIVTNGEVLFSKSTPFSSFVFENQGFGKLKINAGIVFHDSSGDLGNSGFRWGKLFLGDDLDLKDGHIIITQTTAPTTTLTSTTLNDGGGSGATLDLGTGSTDTAGSITITAGNGTPGAGIAGQIVFETAYGAAPKMVMLTAKNAGAADRDFYVSAAGTASFEIAFFEALATSEVVELYYMVIE